MNLTIRPAKLNDFNDIFLLFQQLWPGKELHLNDLLTVYSRGLCSDSDEFICADINNKVLGFCSYAVVNNFWQEGQIAYIYAMIIDESLRGQGIGTQLLKQAFESAKAKGCKKIELDSGFHREKAHKFYEKIGFKKRAYLFSQDLSDS